MKTYDMIIRQVEHYGYLPIIKDWNNEDREVFRGEFRKTPEECIEAMELWIEETA